MQSAINYIYGRVLENDILYEPSEEYRKRLDDLIKCDDAVLESLKEFPAIMKQYQAAMNAQAILQLVELEGTYAAGFRLGLLLGIDVFRTKDE